MKRDFNLISLYDVSFSLLFIFLFLFAYYIPKIANVNEPKNEEKKKILQINIGEKELFNEGEFIFKDETIAVDIIKKNISNLYNLWKGNDELCNKKIKNILVIGHTDNKQIGKKLKEKYHNPNYSNWNLSLDRANQVVNLIIQKNMFVEFPDLSYGLLLPAGKSYFVPATENIREYLKFYSIYYVQADTSKVGIMDANPDEIWKYILNNFTTKEIDDIIEFCNRSPEVREKNRRIEIRLELWD